MRPSVGRIVHYVSHGTPPRADGTQAYGSECRAAVITETGQFEPGHVMTARALEVGLCVLNPTGQFFNCDVPQDSGSETGYEGSSVPLCDGKCYAGGTWHWPEIVREPGDRPPRH